MRQTKPFYTQSWVPGRRNALSQELSYRGNMLPLTQTQCTKNLAEGPEFSNLILSAAALLLCYSSIHIGTMFCWTIWPEVVQVLCCCHQDNSFCKEVLLQKIETTSHRTELRPGQSSMCKVKHKNIKSIKLNWQYW